MNTQASLMLSADKALVDPRDDRLGYAPFAKQLAAALYEMTPPEGLVLAIYGPWGAGKTSLLSFVKYYLEQRGDDQRIVVMSFNPWWFSGHEELTRSFFTELQRVLNKRNILPLDTLQKIGNLAGLVSSIPTPVTKLGGDVVQQLAQLSEKSVPDHKLQISEALRKQSKRILIIIDDIDRLSAEEIRQLFRVIKIIADFPNVIYLLAFDRQVVVKALESTQGLPGSAYLEKIIQVPFELPIADKFSLHAMLYEQLNDVLAANNGNVFDSTRFDKLFLNRLDRYITTPRDISRLINTITVTYSVVAQEVNPVDFIALEILRVFEPFVYDTIRSNLDLFVGHSSGTLHQANAELLTSFHGTWIGQVRQEDQDTIKEVIMLLFPKLRSVWSNASIGSDQLSSWRKLARVCSPEVAPIYFRLTLPSDSASMIEVRNLISLSYDARLFGSRLLELANQRRFDGATMAAVYLHRLRDFADSDMPLTNTPPIIQSFYDVGDELYRMDENYSSHYSTEVDTFISNISRILLRRIDKKERYELLKNVIERGRALSIMVSDVRDLGLEHGKYGSDEQTPEDQRLITTDDLVQLEELVLQAIRRAAEHNNLLMTPKLRLVLQAWRNWGTDDEVKNWVQDVIQDDTNVGIILSRFLAKSFVSTYAEEGYFYSFNLPALAFFIDPHQLVDTAKRLSTDLGTPDIQRESARLFIEAIKKKEPS